MTNEQKKPHRRKPIVVTPSNELHILTHERMLMGDLDPEEGLNLFERFVNHENFRDDSKKE